jgi:hypothetical protein
MTKKETTFDHLKEAVGDGSGFEGLNMDTMAIPFIRLLQELSPQLKKSKPEYIPEAEAGQFVNTVTNRLYSPPLRVVIGKFERYYIEWGTSRGKFIAAHDPEHFETQILPQCVRDEKNKIIHPTTNHRFVDTYVYYVILPDHLEEGVCIISLYSSGIKEAKRLNRNLTHTIIPGSNQRALPYFMIWEVSVTNMKNDDGEWFGLRFDLDEFVTQDQLSHVVEERKALPQRTVDLTMIGGPEETTTDSSTEKDNPY